MLRQQSYQKRKQSKNVGRNTAPTKTDTSILKNEDDVKNRETQYWPVIREEVGKAARMLKDCK